jgi:flagellar M-ring protein FliF
VNLPFADAPLALEPEKGSLIGSILTPTKDDILRWAELAVISVLTMVVLLVVVRPMIRRILAPDLVGAEQVPALAGPDGAVAALPGGGPTALPAGAARPGATAMLAGTDPAQQQQHLSRVGPLVRENPKQAAAVLRGWMADG